MPFQVLIVAKLTLAPWLSVKNAYTRFNEKPTKDLVADARYLTELRTDGGKWSARRAFL